MKRGNKQLLVVGDRVLVKPEKTEAMTKVGLFLPPGVLEKEEVRGGHIVAVGPGQPLPPPTEEHEPWKDGYKAPRFLPMQVGLGARFAGLLGCGGKEPVGTISALVGISSPMRARET